MGVFQIHNQGGFRKYLYWLIAVIGGDTLLTSIGMFLGLKEKNPLLLDLIARFGLFEAMMLKLLVLVIASFCFYYAFKMSKTAKEKAVILEVMFVCIAVYVVVFIGNTIILSQILLY